MFRSFLRVLRTISPFHFAAGTVTPDPNHLVNDREVFRSPLVQSSFISDLLARNLDFVKALPQLDEDLLLIVAVCGRELRVNVHRVEQDRHLEPVYNPLWMNHGLFNYYVHANGNFELLRRPMPGKYYHDEDVWMSFVHPLSVAEYDELAPMLMRYVPFVSEPAATVH